MRPSVLLSATDRRARVVGALFMVAVNVVWLTPILVYLVRLSLERPVAGGLLAAVTLACGMVTGRLPPLLFALTRWEAQRMPYRRLGVRRFRAFVFDGDVLNGLVRSGRPFSIKESRQALAVWSERSLIYERIHWAWLVLSLPIVAYAAVDGAHAFAVYLALADVPMNIYPILLQRDTRARLTRLLAKEPK